MPYFTAGIFIAGIVLLLWGLRIAVNRYIKHAAHQAQIIERDPLLTGLEAGRPAVVYFTSPGCGPCRTTQRPILQQLEKELGDTFQLLTINIEENLSDAMRWGVMKVPRTFVLDHNLRVHTSNMSIASLATLKQQLTEAEQNAGETGQQIKFV